MPWHFPQLSGQDVLDPEPLYEAALTDGSQQDFWQRANSITVPIGQEPGSAWMVVPRRVIDAMDLNALHSLTWQHGDAVGQSGTTTTWAGWVIYRAVCVGLDGDSNAAYLVELRDRRQILKLSDCDKQYNFSVPMPDGTYPTVRRYWPETINGSSPWTWQEVLENLWDLLPPSVAGACPTLPWTPAHVPQNLRLLGISAWEAIGRVLDDCQSAIVMDPFLGTFSVVALGDTQPGLADSFEALASRLIIDWKPKTDCNQACAPETISVAFPKRTRDANTTDPLHQWEHAPTHTIPLASGIAGARAGTVLQINSDLHAEIDDVGAVTNASELTTTATTLTTRVASRIDVASERMRKHYSGVVTSLSLGPQLHCLRWRYYSSEDGLVTEATANPDWGVPPSAHKTPARDIPRFAIVQLSGTWAASGTGSDVWPRMDSCPVVRYFPSAPAYKPNTDETLITVWHPLGYPPSERAAAQAIHYSNGVWPAKLACGAWAWAAWNATSQRWELLAEYEDIWRFVLTAPLTRYGSAAAHIMLRNGSAWGEFALSFVVHDSMGMAIPNPGDSYVAAGTTGFAKYFADACKWEVVSLAKPEGAIDLHSACIVYSAWETAADVEAATDITVNKRASLKLNKKTAAPHEAMIDIGAPVTDHIFWQGPGGREPRWMASPRLAGSIQLDKFLRLGNDSTVFHLHPPSMVGGAQKIRWPTTVPAGINAHLYVNALDANGQNIQTEWGYQGCDFDGYGYFGAACASLACTYVTIRRGIVTNIAGLSTNPAAGDSGTVECDVAALSPYDPCDGEGGGGDGGTTAALFVSGADMSFVGGQEFEFVGE